MSWWAIAATGCRGQYGHGAPVPVGAVGAAARIVACDPSEEGVSRFNQGGLRFGHCQCGPRASRTAALWRWATASGMPAFAGEGCGRVAEGDSGARWQGAEGQGHDAAGKPGTADAGADGNGQTIACQGSGKRAWGGVVA